MGTLGAPKGHLDDPKGSLVGMAPDHRAAPLSPKLGGLAAEAQPGYTAGVLGLPCGVGSSLRGEGSAHRSPDEAVGYAVGRELGVDGEGGRVDALQLPLGHGVVEGAAGQEVGVHPERLHRGLRGRARGHPREAAANGGRNATRGAGWRNLFHGTAAPGREEARAGGRLEVWAGGGEEARAGAGKGAKAGEGNASPRSSTRGPRLPQGA